MLPFSQEVLHYDTIYLFKGGFLLAVQLHGLYCSVTCHCLCLLFMTWLLGGLPNHHHPTWSLLFTAEKATSTGRLPLLLLSLECKIQDNSPYFCTNCSVAHFYENLSGLPLALVTTFVFLSYAIWQKWFDVSLFFSLSVFIHRSSIAWISVAQAALGRSVVGRYIQSLLEFSHRIRS